MDYPGSHSSFSQEWAREDGSESPNDTKKHSPAVPNKHENLVINEEQQDFTGGQRIPESLLQSHLTLWVYSTLWVHSHSFLGRGCGQISLWRVKSSSFGDGQLESESLLYLPAFVSFIKHLNNLGLFLYLENGDGC